MTNTKSIAPQVGQRVEYHGSIPGCTGRTFKVMHIAENGRLTLTNEITDDSLANVRPESVTCN